MPSNLETVRLFRDAFLSGELFDDDYMPSMASHLWFRRRMDGRPVFVPYKAISDHADREYLDFMAVDHRIYFDCNVKDQMRHWLETTPLEDIAVLMATIPKRLHGEPPFRFTPAQRMYMLVTLYRPFSVTSKVQIAPEQLREIAEFDPHLARQRQIQHVAAGQAVRVQRRERARGGRRRRGRCGCSRRQC